MAQKPPAQPFSYGQLYATDPVLRAVLAHDQVQDARNKKQLQAARDAALISYGIVPSDLPAGMVGDLTGVTDSTRQLAQQATDSGLSTIARLARSYTERQSGDLGGLYARNALHSGDYKRLSENNLQDYQVAKSDAANQLLGQLAGYWNTYTGQQQQLADRNQNAVTDAYGRILSGIGNGTIAAPSAPPRAPSAPAAPPRSKVNVGAVAASYEPHPGAVYTGAPVRPARPTTPKPPRVYRGNGGPQ